MSIAAKLRRAPLRVSTGAFLLNSGITKLSTHDEDTAHRIHAAASGAFPQFQKVEPKVFFRTLGIAETAVGAALLLPIVPAGLAGLGLATFSGALLIQYWRTPGMHEEGSIRPTSQGTAFAKDVWMFGSGTSLVIDALLQGAHDKRTAASAKLSAAAAAGAVTAGTGARRMFGRARTVAADKTSQAVEAAKAAKEEHGPEVAAVLSSVGAVVAEKASHALEAAKAAKDEHAPTVASALHAAREAAAEKAAHAIEAAKAAKDQYGPTMVEAAHTARDVAADKAAQARDVAAEKAAQARDVAAEKAAQAREAARR
jgi:hypothetical protein